MRRSSLAVLAMLSFCGGSFPGLARAAQTSMLATVVMVGTYGNQADTHLFELSTQPSTGCANNYAFEISPATVPDAQSRKNLLAVLLTAKASGGQLSVVYDTGTFCDTMGFPAVYSLFLY